MKRSPLKKKSNSETTQAKDRIQALCRGIAIQRDGGCFLRHYVDAGKCGGYRKDGELILQFDHLNSRIHNISYGDPRLGVCVCKRHHFYWKRQYPYQYMKFARDFIGTKRAILLDRVEADRKSYPYGIYEWLKIEIALTQELAKYK